MTVIRPRRGARAGRDRVAGSGAWRVGDARGVRGFQAAGFRPVGVEALLFAPGRSPGLWVPEGMSFHGLGSLPWARTLAGVPDGP
jgi:hypothetical protein